VSLGNVAHGILVSLTLTASASVGEGPTAELVPPAGDPTRPSPTDTWEVDGSAVTEVQAYLEHLHSIDLFLRWHSVQRWESTGLIDCESRGDWHLDGRHDGGAQFSPRTWRAMGGEEFARYAWQAEPWQQVVVADRLVAYEQAHGRGGYGPWASCARRLGLPR
jgi:hypothetical protein